MRVQILGSAAGGGSPQWNCACPACVVARREGRQRTQDSVAVSGDGQAWYLLNASPDIRAQTLATPCLTPGPGLRETPLRGVLLTTAELDHTAGLLSLREAPTLLVYATSTVTRALAPMRQLLDAYTATTFRPFPPLLDGGLSVRSLTVGTKRPRYAAGQPGADWVSALRVTSARTSFVYATCLPEWTDEFDEFVRGADEALIDGTFATEDELPRTTGRPGSARSMGHLPIASSRERLAGHPHTRFHYSHLNNTNASSGPGIAGDGLTLGVPPPSSSSGDRREN
jgi:pyrroloquinoline quinone biosynthesis protein B